MNPQENGAEGLIQWAITPENSGVEMTPAPDADGEFPEDAITEGSILTVGWFQPK